MKFENTTAVREILKMKKRLRIVQGGTGAGKTIAILLILIDKAQSLEGKIISVVSETIPHLKRGAIRNFLEIVESHSYYKDDRWNKTDYIYTFETGSKIEFFSADQPGLGPQLPRSTSVNRNSGSSSGPLASASMTDRPISSSG